MCQRKVTCLNNTVVFLLGVLAGMVAVTGMGFFTPGNIGIVIIASLTFYFSQKFTEPAVSGIKQFLSIF